MERATTTAPVVPMVMPSLYRPTTASQKSHTRNYSNSESYSNNDPLCQEGVSKQQQSIGGISSEAGMRILPSTKRSASPLPIASAEPPTTTLATPSLNHITTVPAQESNGRPGIGLEEKPTRDQTSMDLVVAPAPSPTTLVMPSTDRATPYNSDPFSKERMLILPAQSQTATKR